MGFIDIDMDGFDFDLNMFDDKSIDNDNPPEKRDRRRKTECIVRSDKLIYRKAYSETQLLDAVGFDFKEGESYHCITAGDVDSLSYLKCVLRQQDLDYCLFSTWCMAADDIMQFEEWLEDDNWEDFEQLEKMLSDKIFTDRELVYKRKYEK